ncbi:hypothetical protein E2C01_008127 [Portunus trituberculatus]|uniref:Uncharacterized protein n=1 Tax=Portunus trituberculatus TaxID=210409 RepID=A0A5B7D0T3_PORTR|nr:hypothetical protein [Portunus trituberculatus]
MALVGLTFMDARAVMCPAQRGTARVAKAFACKVTPQPKFLNGEKTESTVFSPTPRKTSLGPLVLFTVVLDHLLSIKKKCCTAYTTENPHASCSGAPRDVSVSCQTAGMLGWRVSDACQGYIMNATFTRADIFRDLPLPNVKLQRITVHS